MRHIKEAAQTINGQEKAFERKKEKIRTLMRTPRGQRGIIVCKQQRRLLSFLQERKPGTFVSWHRVPCPVLGEDHEPFLSTTSLLWL